ncbi:hypothetical protein BHE74_00043996 [Ensete ventricosum]|nr:hypothetical protein BHE74_00043996 [Ensete ventricosum]
MTLIGGAHLGCDVDGKRQWTTHPRDSLDWSYKMEGDVASPAAAPTEKKTGIIPETGSDSDLQGIEYYTISSHHVPRGPSSQAFRHTVGFVVTWRSAAGRPASSFLFLVASAHQKREILTDRVGRDFESGPWKGAGEGRRVFIRTAAGDGSIFSFSDLLSLRLLPKVQKGTAMKWAVV